MPTHVAPSQQTPVRFTAISPRDLRPNQPAYQQLEQLWQRCPQARFYQHPHWLHAAATHLCPELMVWFIEQDEQLVGCLWLQPRRYQGFALPRCFTGANHPHWTLADWLLSEALTLSRLFSALETSPLPEGCAIAQLSVLRSTQPTQAPEQTEDTDHRLLSQAAGYTAEFNLQGDQAPIPGKLRRNLKRLHKQAEAQHRLRFESYQSPEAINTHFEAWLALEKSGWKADTAIAQASALREFYHSLSTAFGAEQRCAINALYFDERLVAVQFALKDTFGWNLLKIAYDEHEKALAPGLLLLQWLINTEHAQGEVTGISLVTSPEWAKRWHPEQRRVRHLHYCSPTLLGQGLKAALRLYLKRQTRSEHP